jgi:hypothetical protein
MNNGTVKWKKVLVFVSSTFNDMHAERDYLIKRVFPELQAWCERRKLRLIDIDLRWGVTEQDVVHNQNVIKVCLSRIDDCRPFFLCFIGQRRGEVPTRNEVSEDTYEVFPDLRQFVGSASLTELEILHAVATLFHGSLPHGHSKPHKQYERAKHSFFYLRDPSYLSELPDNPPMLRKTYTNDWIEEVEQRQHHDLTLKEWREQKIPHFGRPFHLYQANWKPDGATPELMLPLQCPSTEPINVERWKRKWLQAGITEIGLNIDDDSTAASEAREFNRQFATGRLYDFNCEGTALNRLIIAELKEAIIEQFPDHSEAQNQSDLQKEIHEQEQFLFTASEGFIERSGDFRELDNYVESDSQHLFALTGQAGIGKSTLLANWIERYRTRVDGNNTDSIHFRFIGQSDGTTTVYSMLRSVLTEIKEVAHKLSEEIPLDPVKLSNEWALLLKAISKRGQTVIVMDALDQFGSGLKDISWLPQSLPENIKLIVSFDRSHSTGKELYDRFSERRSVSFSEVEPFENVNDRERLVRAYLSQYLKDLDEPHQKSLINLPGAENPLYLKVVLSELRVFGAYSNLATQIGGDFGDNPVSAFVRLLERLENDPAYTPIAPKQAVPLLFGLLAHARRGLSVAELTRLFIQRFQLEESDESEETAADTINFILRQVRPFLARREGRFDFFFESFRKAVEVRFVPDEAARAEFHEALASCFRGLAKEDWTGEARSLRELPFHLAASGRQQELHDLLFNISYVDTRCNNGDVQWLLRDFDDIAAADEAIDQMREFIFANVQRLETKRDILFGLIQHEGSPLLRRHAEDLLLSSQWKRAWVRTSIVPLPRPVANQDEWNIKVVAQYNFERSAATSLAETMEVAFYLKKLGSIGIINTHSMRELPERIVIPNDRVLRLCATSDGHSLAAVFENGNLLILELEFADDRTLLSQRAHKAYRYLVPECEPPVVQWNNSQLLFQREDGDLVIVENTVEKIIPLPDDCYGELSAAVFSRGEWVVTIRQGPNSCVWRCESDEKVVIEATDVLSAACTANNSLVLALSDRTIREFQTRSSLRQSGLIETKDLPVCIGAWKGGVVWAEQANLWYWDSAQNIIVALNDDETLLNPRLYLRIDQISKTATEDLVVLGDYRVSQIIPLSSGAPTASHRVEALLVGNENEIYAIQKRDQELWLVDCATERELRLVPNATIRYFHVLDNSGHLLTMGITGGGSLTDLSSHLAHQMQGPMALNAVAVNKGVFWLTDRFGAIYRLTKDNILSLESKRREQNFNVGHLRIFQNWLVWQGNSTDISPENPFGDPQHCLLFFNISDDQPYLNEVGFRSFTKEDGILEVIVTADDSNEVHAIFYGHSEFGLCVKVGTPEQFLQHEERTTPMDFNSTVIDCVMNTQDGVLYVYSGDFDIVVVDLETFRTRCRLSVSWPFTAVVHTSGRGIVAVEAGKRLYRCSMEVPHAETVCSPRGNRPVN